MMTDMPETLRNTAEMMRDMDETLTNVAETLRNVDGTFRSTGRTLRNKAETLGNVAGTLRNKAEMRSGDVFWERPDFKAPHILKLHFHRLFQIPQKVRTRPGWVHRTKKPLDEWLSLCCCCPTRIARCLTQLAVLKNGAALQQHKDRPMGFFYTCP